MECNPKAVHDARVEQWVPFFSAQADFEWVAITIEGAIVRIRNNLRDSIYNSVASYNRIGLAFLQDPKETRGGTVSPDFN